MPETVAYPKRAANGFPLSLSLCFLILTVISTPAIATIPVQKLENTVSDVLINEGWGYYEIAVKEPAAVPKTITALVNLPHSWNSIDATDSQPGYRRDASWYRKLFKLAQGTTDHRYSLYFEGANMTASVFVNGKKAGGHVGGYLGFEIEITQ